MKNYLTIFLICFNIKVLFHEMSIAQNYENVSYENQYFTLDFENNRYQLSDLEKYFFTTFPHNDPTQGDVIYDRKKWINSDMFKLSEFDGFYAFIKSRNDSLGFDSFRLTTKPYYNISDQTKKILFVFKGEFPSAKGLWPALWLNGSREDQWLYKNNYNSVSDEYLDNFSGIGQFYNTPSPVNCTDWPSAGEIDIVETINGNNIIHNTIHTCPQMCDSEWNDDGIIINCANAKQFDPNAGCSGKSYKVNELKGTFACLWEEGAISFYYWEPHVNVRANGYPLSHSPNPELWKNSSLKNYVRLLNSTTDCDEKVHQDWQCNSCKDMNKCIFKNLKMILNITVCGVWAGREFDETDNSTNNCKEFILSEGNNEIDNKYIKIEYISVSKIE